MKKSLPFSRILFAIAMLPLIILSCEKDKDVAVTDVALNETAVVLVPGETLTLSTIFSPNNATNQSVVWTSNNPSIATVSDNGTITAVAMGTTSITVISTENNNKRAYCNVAVAGITLNRTTALLGTYSTLSLSADRLLPANALISWSSSDTTIATVNSAGRVTPKLPGEVTISATVQDGKITATCAVSVKEGSNTTAFGFANFATKQTWTVGSQIWSDVVETSFCRDKTTFGNGSLFTFIMDCRSNPDQKGDLFSWSAVDRYKSEFCPAPWRVPTQQDFINLDIAMGGTGNNQFDNPILYDKYLNDWGATLGGYCDQHGARRNVGHEASYWSQSPPPSHSTNTTDRLQLRRSSQSVLLTGREGREYIAFGLSLRCVRDN